MEFGLIDNIYREMIKIKDGFNIVVETNLETKRMRSVTMGFQELYNKPEIELVLPMDKRELVKIMERINVMYSKGMTYEPDYIYSGILDWLLYPIKFKSFGHDNVLRLIIPDQYGRFPENSKCRAVFKNQYN